MKKILKIIKLNILGGQAKPIPPLGPSLGAIGVNIVNFCKIFNERTKNKNNKLLFINIIVYEDKTFDFIIKKSTVKNKILSLLNIKKGSSEPNKKKVGDITIEEIYKIAKYKMPDLNCYKLKSAVSMIIGSLRSMGINIKKYEKIN